MALAVCSEVSALRGPVCAVRMTSRQARLASFIVFYLVIIKNRGSFCELRLFLEPWRSFCASWIGVCGSHDVNRLDWFVLSSVLSVKI